MGKRNKYKKTSIYEKIIESIVVYSIVIALIILSFILLNKLSKTNFKINNIAKPVIKSTSPVIKSTTPIINKTEPKVKTVKSDANKIKTNIKNIKPKTKITNKANPTNQKVVINKISRSKAFKRGMDIINYVWNYNVNNNGIKNDKLIDLPNYLKGEKQITTSGLPYCWGGYLSLDKSGIFNIKNFQDSIKKGYTAGNVNCTGNYKSFTAGLDCSGFVCAVFNIPSKYGTGTLEKYFKNIDEKDLKPMDILDCKAEHVFIYLKETNDKKGILTMESSVNRYAQNSEKTNIYYRSWESIKKGVGGKPYVAMRYKGIVEDKVEGFKDSNEFNNETKYATLVKLNQKCKGYIDYADDIDYFRWNTDKNSKLILRLSSVPKYSNMYVINNIGKIILKVSKTGTYILNLAKGTYYFKIVGVDFKFRSNEAYSFDLKNFKKANTVKIKKSKNVHMK